jgi:membrane protease YdiL (CAAX protease family)
MRSHIDIDGVVSQTNLIKGIGFGIACSVIFLLFSSFATFFNIPVIDVGDELGISGELNRVIAFVFIVLLFNAPAEEFLYRNIIQKRLIASYRGSTGIAIATLIFMSVHIPTYLVAGDLSTHGVVGMVFPLFIIALLGGVLGWVYYQTEDLWVPIITHAVYNVSQLVVYVFSSGVV